MVCRIGLEAILQLPDIEARPVRVAQVVHPNGNDLGTGTGRILELLAPRARRGTGIDQSREMLSIARARLEQAAQWLGISGQVKFDQKLPSTHLPHYFSGLDVLVTPEGIETDKTNV